MKPQKAPSISRGVMALVFLSAVLDFEMTSIFYDQGPAKQEDAYFAKFLLHMVV